MERTGRRSWHATLLFLLLVAFAYGIEAYSSQWDRPNPAWFVTGLLRSGVYIGLFAAWGVSVHRRVLQPQVRRYLSAISALLVFWMVVRTAKYFLFQDAFLCRHLWYSFYIPQIVVPLMLVFVACSLGEPETYRLPRWANVLYILAAVLPGLILTNDVHQLAFGFPSGLAHFENGEYTHKAVYFLSVGWILACVLVVLVMLYRKCRVPGSKKRVWLPSIPVAAMVMYCAAYLLAFPLLKFLHLRDMTVISCLFIVAMLESCIRCGLLRSNTGYGELFRCSGIGAVLVDSDYSTVLSSRSAPSLPAALMAQTEKGPVLLDGDLRLSGAPIKSGHVLWTEDVSELTALLETLAERKEDLKEETALLRENYNTELRIRQLSEKNRLYDEIHRQTAAQIAQLGELICRLEASRDEEEKKRLLKKLVIIGVYLKRRSNLILISEQSKSLPAQELSLCFEETMEDLKLSGVSCGCYIAFSHDLPPRTATALYDFAQQVIESAYDTLRSLLIRVFETEAATAVSLELSCRADLSGFASEHVSVSRGEDGLLCLVLQVPKGGGAE